MMSETISRVINDIVMDDIIFKNDSFTEAFSWAPYSDIYKHSETGPFFMPKIEKVIFNPPATIVFWSDGTKTVVKCDDGEFFDREKGLAMAISKKTLGNKGNYYNEFRKWIDTEDQNEEPKVHIKTDYETMETVVRIDGMSDANSFENIANILLEKLRYCTYGGDHK